MAGVVADLLWQILSRDPVAMFSLTLIRDRQGTPKNFYDKDFAELLCELSGATCLKTLVLLGIALKLFRQFFWCCSCDSLALGFFFGP